VQTVLKASRFAIGIALLASVVLVLLRGTGTAAEATGKVDIAVECKCPDPVGQNLCSTFKKGVQDSAGYRLVDAAKGFGMSVHLSCVDLWQGIDSPLAGTMSAVSLVFTIYADGLPGEVYEDSSVTRVGKDATADMSRKIIAALGQLVSVNSSFFEHMRATAQKSAAPAASPSGPPSPAGSEQ
jgi:hypothetical protein